MRFSQGEPALDHFIRWYDDALSKDICREIVRRFEADPNKLVGHVADGSGTRVDPNLKQTTELYIDNPQWADMRQVLNDSLNKWLTVYAREVEFLKSVCHDRLAFERPRLKKYDIGQQFDWHVDCTSPKLWERSLAMQWYFNDVAEGGETEFEVQQVSIPCVEGRLAFFPVAWTYRHRGSAPKSGPKYVCTTFVRPRWEVSSQ